MNKYISGLFLLTLLLALILRVYQVTIVPPHQYWDESAISYNAYSIAETGKDEWGISHPFLFKSFGDYKLPLYIYTTMFSQKLLGLTDLAVRAPSILAGTLTVMFVFFLTFELVLLSKKKFPDSAIFKKPELIAIVAMLMVAISPWSIHFSRGGFEANLALFFEIGGVTVFLYSLRKNINLLFVSVILFSLSYYTYHAAAISTSLIILALAGIFYKELAKNSKKFALAIVIFLLAVSPYVYNYVLSPQGQTRGRSENFFNMKGNPIVNLPANYASNFSLDFLFFKGDQNGRHSVKKMGELYTWQLPFVLAGIYVLLKKNSKGSLVVFSLLLISAVPPTLTTISPHSLRGLVASVPWMLLTAFGVIFISLKIKFFKYLLVPVVIYSLYYYLHLYFVFYPTAYEADWQSGRKEAVEYLKRIEKNYDQVFLSTDLEPIYLYLYMPINPKEVHASKNHQSVGKFVYTRLDRNPTKKNPSKKSLIVAPGWMSPNQSLVLKREVMNKYHDSLYRIYEF